MAVEAPTRQHDEGSGGGRRRDAGERWGQGDAMDPSSTPPEPSEPRRSAPPRESRAPESVRRAQRLAAGLLARIGAALVAWQTKRPAIVLAIGLLSAALAALGASKLTLKTSFGELLPAGKRSVIVADRVNERLASATTLTIVAEGPGPEPLIRFVDALVPELAKIGPEYVGGVDWGVKATTEFFAKNRVLYAPLEDLRAARDAVVERYEYEIAKRAGTLLDDTDPPPPLGPDTLRERFAKHEKAMAEHEARHPGGYYLEPGGRMIAVLVRTPIGSADLDRTRELMKRIEAAIARAGPERIDPGLRIRFTGDLITSAEEYRRIKNDLGEVGAAGVLAILLSVFLYFLRIRPLVGMTISVGIGLTWTFGFTWLAIGHLNSSTGFLASIVAGNGINFGIIYMARYLEARRTEPVTASIATAHRETWVSTLAGAAAAMVAYGSLVVTAFRGFKHFGVVGGAGMILCWIATYLFLPPILVLFERAKPLGLGGAASRFRGLHGRAFAWLSTTHPRAVAITGLAIGLAALAVSIRYFVNDPMEYDMANIRSEAKEATEARLLSHRVSKVVGRIGQDGLAIAVERIEHVRPLAEALEQKRKAAPEGKKPFEKVVTIFDLLPRDQEAKIELAKQVRDLFERARRRGLVTDEAWARIEEHLPASLHPIGIDDLPEQVARPFTEKDGTRGRLVYIVPTSGRSIWDGRYLIEWADSFRKTVLPDGTVVEGSGRAVIFADLVLAVVEDAPKAIAVSAIGTLLVVLAAFRGRRATWAAIATLMLGVFCMTAVIALWGSKLEWVDGLPKLTIVGMKLNFLNFVALPIALGIGVDYGVNVLQRYELVGPGRVREAIERTGGAVVLCSLTTVLGYWALTLSVNRAIASFGIAAASGELACLLSAVLVLPAWIEWRDRRRAARADGAKNGSRSPR